MGSIVDQYTGLPTAFPNPGNYVRRKHLFNVGATEVIGPNSYSLINCVLGRSLTDSILYAFAYQSDGVGLGGGRTGDVGV